MKKLFALLLALCLLVPMAMAEETTLQVNWADLESVVTDAGLEGSFVTFDEIAVTMWLPAQLQSLELTDEYRESGYIGYFIDEEQTAAVAVVYVDVSGMTLEEYAEMLPDLGASEIAHLMINDIPALRYQLPENDTLNITFATDAGCFLEFTFYPLSTEGAAEVWTVVIASIQPE